MHKILNIDFLDKKGTSSIGTYFCLLFFLWIGPSSSLEQTKAISYSHFILENNISAHVLEVNPKEVAIVAAKAKGPILETVPTIAKRYHALAAVNGGFFQQNGDFGDLPMGILKVNNEWCATPFKARGAIGWSVQDEKVLFDQVLTDVFGYVEGQRFLIDGINRIKKNNQTVLYNRFFHPRTSTEFSGKEFIVKDGIITDIGEKNSKIPPEGYVLAMASKQKTVLKAEKGQRFKFDVEVIPQSIPAYTDAEAWKKTSYIVGGCPILIRNGEILTDFSLEKSNDNFLFVPHARTAVGVLKNGHWLFVTIDGDHSLIVRNNGMTIPELCAFMKSLGCVEALNVDGGGSTTMFYQDHVINRPCGEENDGTRKVSDAILILPLPAVE